MHTSLLQCITLTLSQCTTMKCVSVWGAKQYNLKAYASDVIGHASAEHGLSSLSCMYVDQNKGNPPPDKGNFDEYRFDLTKNTPPPLKFYGCKLYHYTSFIKGNFNDYRFDLTKNTPPPGKNFMGVKCNIAPPQGSHSTWKTWENEGTPGKPGNIMEFWKI